MKQTQPIFWYQGLFLQPQHFQQQDFYFQSLLYPYQMYQQPYFWGVCRMHILESALNNKMFEIVSGEFIFQDGSWVVFPDNAVLSPRSFKEFWSDDKPLHVFLGLRKWNIKGENVTVLNNPDDAYSASTRFVTNVNPQELQDVHHNGPPAQIKFLNHHLNIFFEKEIEGAGDYGLIPLARIERVGNDIVLSEYFVPPCVSIACSDTLLQTIKNIREQVKIRCLMLEEYKLPKEAQLADAGPGFMMYILALRTLSRYVPLLQHITETPIVHPWNAYAVLRQLIGELSIFTDRIDALGNVKGETPLLPEYRHDNPGQCFYAARTLIGELLNAITLGAENIIHFSREGGYFKALIPHEAFDSRHLFYLVMKTSRERSEVLDLLLNIIKVSCEELMPTLIKRALPGIPLEYSISPQPGLPKRSDSLYLKLDRSSDHWLEIQKGQNICMYWSDAPEDTTVDLVIIKK